MVRAIDDEAVRRASELKQELLAFGYRTPRISRPLEKHLADAAPASECDLINAVDQFLLQVRLADGRTPVEHFCGSLRELSERDRSIVLGWRDVVEGVFEVAGHDGDSLEATNLVDDLSYRVVSNLGPAGIAAVRAGDYLFTRIAPLGDVWMLTGVATIMLAADRPAVLRAAAELAVRHPELAFRNEHKLARAWEVQNREREHFIEYFGADLVLLSGAEVQQRWTGFWQWRLRQPPHQAQAAVAPAMDFALPDTLTSAETVGVIYDQHEGMTLLADYGRVHAAFADPDLATDRTCQQTVLGYLNDDSVSTLPFRRLADPRPEQASRLFARLLNKPRFRWERDGEALLRRYKPDCFTRASLPTVSPLGATLANALRAA